jgi:L-ascorbate metabolism protein UlaG (beta-lactamase superfamily)
MELTWYGLSCFRLVERSFSTIVTDPHGEASGLILPRIKTDIVTRSNELVDGDIAGATRTLTGPGEYEIGGVFITGVASRGKARNTIFRFDMNGVTVVHVGRLTKLPSQLQIEALGEVNVLLLPVGGGNRLNGVLAAELVAMIEPGIVVPMHFAQEGITKELDGVEKFLNEMGSAELEPASTLRVSSGSVPEETQIVLLTPKL